MKKINLGFWVIGISLVFVFCCLFFTISGCGQSSSSSSTNYTIQGKVSGFTASGVRISAADTVTHIVAIGSNSEKHLIVPDADGGFSLGVNKGIPYVLGFYNQSGGVVTLLGYLQQSDVSWESLPLMNPTDSLVDVGTIEINSTSLEATPSINLTSLIDKMNIPTQADAQYYGTLDDAMVVMTNLDVNSSGDFDFNEGKHYLFQTYVNVGNGTGQIQNMLNGNYNDSYIPRPTSYSITLTAKGDDQTYGTIATFQCPQQVADSKGNYASSITAEVEATGGGEGWVCFSAINGEGIMTPEVAPAGTYTVEVGSKTYTFRNYHAPTTMAVGATNNLVYPVFNLVTNEAGYITTVNYKWYKLVNGTPQLATAEEVKLTVEDTSLTPASTDVYIHSSPFISFFKSESQLIGSVINFVRDSSSKDISSLNVKFSEVHHIQASYNLTSRMVCKFDLY